MSLFLHRIANLFEASLNIAYDRRLRCVAF